MFTARQRDFAVEDPLRGQQLFTEVANLLRRPAEHGHFQAVPLAEVDVQAGDDELVVVVLLVDEAGGQLAGVVVVDERDHGDLLALLVRAAKDGRAPLALYPALVLNDVNGKPSAAAEAVLREGALLRLAEN